MSSWKWLRQFVSQHKGWISCAVIAFVILISAVPIYAIVQSRGEIYTIQDVPKRDVAIVFGAGLEAPHKPSNFLESRLLAAIQLYKSGKVKVLLMSGDNRVTHYNEPVAMRDYAVARGVPSGKIVLDYAGFNTYDTCYRVHNLFGVTQATLVTHGYHLPRALMTCNALGIRSIGVRADRSQASYSKNYLVREFFSLNKAALQLLLHVKPDVLGPQEQGIARALKA